MNIARDQRMCGKHSKMCGTTPLPTESGRALEITENLCYYPPPTESVRFAGITENVCYYPPPLQYVVVPLLDYPLWIRPCK